jgi:hypothetical protein
MQRYLADQGMSATIVPAAALREEIARESAKWKALVEKKKITAS